MMSSCYQNKDEDGDSGLVDDAFDVLPDEQTLALEDYDIDLDLSEDNFGNCSTSEDYSDLLELDETAKGIFDLPADSNSDFKQIDDDDDDGFVDSTVKTCNINNTKSKENNNKKILKPPSPTVMNANSEKNENNGKLVSFSKEQARQWRRMRILKSNEKKSNKPKSLKNYPNKLEPLLPLPKNLKPVSSKSNQTESTKEKVNAEDKLANPLLGGEKISTRTKRGPIPMKLRALPESFWKEPHSIQTSSLARSNYSVLPPLFLSEGKESEEIMHIRPVTPPEEKGRSPRHSPRNKKKWIMASPPDTELLFSLFDHLENKIDDRLIVKRGRPKKTHIEKVPPPPTRTKDDDPCIVDALATKLFPGLSLNHIPGSEEKLPASSNSAVIRIGKGNHSVEFPAIQAKENYPAILTELVTHM